jgi:predicted PurR-regulated permease PerM
VLHLPADIRSFSLAVLAVLACFFVLRWAQAVFVPLVLGMILSYALSPIVNRLQGWRVPRALSAAVLLCALVAGTGSMLYSLSDDAAAVVESLPEAAQRLRRTLQSPQQVPVATIDNVQKAAAELQRAATENAVPAAANPPGVTRVVIEPPRFNVKDYLWTGTLGLAALVGETAVVLLLAFFLLASGDAFRRKMVKLAGPKLSQKRITVDALDEINVQIQRYILVQLFTSAIVGVATGFAFAALGLQHPLVWGLAAGITNLVPYLGAAVIAGTSMLVAFMQFESMRSALWIGAASLAIHAIVANVILPWMTSRTARMSPVTVFVAVLVWGWLWGIWGLLLGVPILMVVKAVCDRVDDLKPVGELLGS